MYDFGASGRQSDCGIFRNSVFEQKFYDDCLVIEILISEPIKNKMAIHITETDEFKSSLEKAEDKLVIVDFFADWCGPCKTLSPKIDEFAGKFGEKVVIIKINVDDFEDIANEYEISSMPTLVFLKAGKELDRFSGTNIEALEKLITQHSENPQTPEQMRASKTKA